MKKIWNKFKNFKYKMISALSLFVLAGVLAQGLGWNFLNYIMWACGTFLVGYTFVAMFHAAKNTWNDGDTGSKILAVVYSALVLGMIGFIAYLLIYVA